MRIAISGSHRVGKTTLAGAVAAALPGHDLVPEPYEQLADDGHEFAAVPSVEDFLLQLERSIECVEQSGSNAVFDRCPADLLGYLLTHRDAPAFRIDEWLPRIQASLVELDLVVFVPIEEPDRIAVSRSEAGWRADVDSALRDIVVDDAYGFDLDVVSVTGTPAARLQQVLARVRSAAEP